eukprot:6484814-Amphidinium_carterae.1
MSGVIQLCSLCSFPGPRTGANVLFVGESWVHVVSVAQKIEKARWSTPVHMHAFEHSSTQHAQ